MQSLSPTLYIQLPPSKLYPMSSDGEIQMSGRQTGNGCQTEEEDDGRKEEGVCSPLWQSAWCALPPSHAHDGCAKQESSTPWPCSHTHSISCFMRCQISLLIYSAQWYRSLRLSDRRDKIKWSYLQSFTKFHKSSIGDKIHYYCRYRLKNCSAERWALYGNAEHHSSTNSRVPWTPWQQRHVAPLYFSRWFPL